MSDNAASVKLIAVLAVVILLANLMGVGAASPFAGLQAAISNGPALPEFSDPFLLKQYIAHVAIPIDNSTTPPDLSWLHGCDLDAYFRCINSMDGNESFIRLPLDDSFNVIMSPGPSGIPDDVRVVRVEVEWQVRTTFANMSVVGFGTNEKVPIVDDTWDSFRRLSYTRIPAPPLDNFTQWESGSMGIAALWGTGAPGETIDISFARYSLYAAGAPACTSPPGAWFPWLDEVACAIGQAIDWAVTALQFAANAVIYAFQTLGGWLLWIGTVIGSFLEGIVAMSLWFLDLEAPAVIQGFFGIMTVVVIGFFFLTIIQLVRG